MQLLEFYLRSLFEFLSFPAPSDICGKEGGIYKYCINTASFTFFYPAIFISTSILFFVKPRLGFKIFAFSIFSSVSLFYFAERALNRISDPANFGAENFIFYFNLWCFIALCLFLLANIFENHKYKFFCLAIATSLVFAGLFIFSGRGNFEHIASLSGTLFVKLSFAGLTKGFVFQLFFASFIFSCIYGFVLLILEWLKSGNIIPEIFFKRLLVICLFLVAYLVPLTSIPFGALINSKDVQGAQNYLNNIKEKVDKYFYENGEYPKVLDDIIDEKSDNPVLLKRHEFFTYGIRGTYYFSRNDKYCFIFQNPAQKFGYYSMTNTRAWQFTESRDSFDDAYINACDESNEQSDGLVSNYLGMATPDDYLNSTAIEFNNPNLVQASKIKTEELHKRIMEYGKDHPEIFIYYGNRPENYMDLIKEKYGE